MGILVERGGGVDDGIAARDGGGDGVGDAGDTDVEGGVLAGRIGRHRLPRERNKPERN
jgi:hypothetical protein